MKSTPRRRALEAIASGHEPPPPRHLAADRLPEIFGSKVFNDAVQRQRLPKPVYQALRRTLDTGAELDPNIADAVASAMKDWAIEKGATHYTHWFQPMTGLTAEKHDAFLSPTLEGGAIQEFSGNELILGEPDASSFPSGGVRNTFEARGYTGWDPGSPAFLRDTAYGKTLTIPTVFVSWTGEALDTKTPLLRSCEAIDRQSRRVLGLLGDGKVTKITATIGPEQEYFLVDRMLYNLRPDLAHCGRTLLGAAPAKGQELEDHYFSLIPRRILDFMMDFEHELWALGVPLKTRHGEVAPHQFETAPVFESASMAIDHNMLTMEVLHDVAQRHGMNALVHEKPFARMNGSGKHLNWSLSTDTGDNLLSPGKTPAENQRFMLFLTAIVRAVDLHQDLLRASIAHAGNDHRLGANEAPPAILSVYLGTELQAVVDQLVAGVKPSDAMPPQVSDLQLGVTTLPQLPIDNSDRNRTSPFAFTGNKFEFRAVGSSQTTAFPTTVLNTIVAESLDHLANQIEGRLQGGNPTKVVDAVIAETLAEHKRILFTGDNYSDEWSAEAERRGLLNLRDTPSALAHFATPDNLALFAKYGVLSERETQSRSDVLYQAYLHRLRVEADTLTEMLQTQVLPAVLEFQGRLAGAIASTHSACPELDQSSAKRLLGEIAAGSQSLGSGIEELTQVIAQTPSGLAPAAEYVRDAIIHRMEALRVTSDHLETLVDDELWPLPKYRELLFAH